MSQPVRQQLCHPWAHHLWRKKKSILCRIFRLGLGASIVFGERQKQWDMWELIIQRNKFQLSLLITVFWIRKMILLSPKIPNRNIHLFSWFETDGQEWFLHTCYLTKEFRKAQLDPNVFWMIWGSWDTQRWLLGMIQNQHCKQLLKLLRMDFKVSWFWRKSL